MGHGGMITTDLGVIRAGSLREEDVDNVNRGPGPYTGIFGVDGLDTVRHECSGGGARSPP